MGRRVATSGAGQDIFEQYRKRLEQDGGLPIRVEENREIPTAAKIEFAENYNRDYHQIRFKPDYPAVDHLKMHELVHLDLVIAARKVSLNQLFISRPEHKEKFIRNLGDFIKSLHKKGYPEQQLANYLTALFEGLNRQIYNAPIDLFIEDFLFQEFPPLRPLQFLSLYRLVQEGLQAVTDKRIVELSPREILSKSKVLNLVGAMQFKMLYGLDLVQKYNASVQEKKEADRLFEEYLEYRPDRKPGEEYEMVQHWAEDLKLTPYFELVDENEYRKPQKRRSLDEALAEMEDDPFDLKKPDPADSERVSMETEPAGQMAVAYYCLGALEWFEGKNREQIQEVAFEISMLGRTGINPRDPDRQYKLATVPGKTFTGLHLLAWMYTGFQLFEPGLDTGLDFAKEYQMALSMHKPKS